MRSLWLLNELEIPFDPPHHPRRVRARVALPRASVHAAGISGITAERVDGSDYVASGHGFSAIGIVAL
jgi:hypothetical protein